MSAINKNKSKDVIIVNPNMKDYSKEPYFEKKAKDASSFIDKHGLPENYTKKIKSR